VGGTENFMTKSKAKNRKRPAAVAGAAICSASDSNPAQCLRAEVERFKATNRFTPMDVTGFYIQAAVVLDEHRRMVEALKLFRDCTGSFGDDIRRIAGRALPMSETARTPNDQALRPSVVEKGKP
jgi:ribosomal protein S7